jgi:hypothetical protein
VGSSDTNIDGYSTSRVQHNSTIHSSDEDTNSKADSVSSEENDGGTETY